MKKIIILTGSDLRHEYFKKYLSSEDSISVLASFCESTKGNLDNKIINESSKSLRSQHLIKRKESERNFFFKYCKETIDKSNSIFIDRGDINLPENVNKIIKINPDLIVSYGCSIIRSNLLKVFKDKFINIHLGLSPYFRGSGTNFWPFVEDKLSLIGTTFMQIDEGIDTGDILHQIRGKINYGDSIHSIGNRLIMDSTLECIKVIKNYSRLKKHSHPVISEGKLFKNKDFTENALKLAYKNIDLKIVNYIENKKILDKKFPIISAFD